jgi:hypothetical protein
MLSGNNLFEYTRLETGCSEKTCNREVDAVLDVANSFNALVNASAPD